MTSRSWFMRARRRPDGDSGQSLILILMISVLIMILMSTAMAALAAQVRPAKQTLDDGVALAAAQAGLENFVAKMNFNCSGATVSCTWPSGAQRYNNANYTAPATHQGTPVPGVGGTGQGSYFWYVVTPESAYASTSTRRVVSIGQVPTSGGASTYRLKYLVADVDGVNGFADFQYYTKYETYSPDFVNTFYRPRTIAVTGSGNLTDTDLDHSEYPAVPNPGAGAKLVWDGTCTYPNASIANCTNVHDTGVCDDLFYDANGVNGRGNDTAWNNNSGRRPLVGNYASPTSGITPTTTTQSWLGTADGGRSGNGSGNQFAYYSETGKYYPTAATPAGSATQLVHNDTCDSTMEPNMVMNGPVYSQDAYLIDRGKDTGAACPHEPQFNAPAYTLFTGFIKPFTQVSPDPGPNGGHVRVYPKPSDQTGAGLPGEACGSATTSGQFPTSLTGLSSVYNLPPNANDAVPQCVYSGSTRILLAGAYAYITSPGGLVSGDPLVCANNQDNTFGNAASAYTAGGGGIVMAKVQLSAVVIKVQNPSSPAPIRADDANPVFNLTRNLTLPANSSSNSLTLGAAVSASGYQVTDPCPSPANPGKERNFDCEAGQSTPPENLLARLQSTSAGSPIKTYLESGVPTASGLQGVIAGMLKPGVTTPPATWTSSGYYYTVTVTAAANDAGDVNADATPATMTAPATAPDDPFLQHYKGKYHTTTTKWNVAINRRTCQTIVLGSCTVFNADTNIITGSVKSVVNTSVAGQSMSFPWTDARATAATCANIGHLNASCRDVTDYYDGYGDAYVEGTIDGTASIIADHDIVITNNVRYANTTIASTNDGLAMVATHNVRVYRPMTCTADDPNSPSITTPGYCPNDTTGLFPPVNMGYPPANNFYSQQYETCVDAGGSAANCPPAIGDGGDIYSTIFALRGSFIADNFFRGYMNNGNGGIIVQITGGLYQYHRGATSLPYQNHPYNTAKMPGITITYNYDNMRAAQVINGGFRVPYIPPISTGAGGSTNGRTWNVVGISTLCPTVPSGTPCS